MPSPVEAFYNGCSQRERVFWLKHVGVHPSAWEKGAPDFKDIPGGGAAALAEALPRVRQRLDALGVSSA